MHQLPRPSPRSATPASNPTTNPERTNNPRDPPPTRSRSSVDLASYAERAGAEPAGMASRTESAAGSSQDKELTKLNQIITHFHTKAALVICSSRASLPRVQNQNGGNRQNRWFGLDIDETDVLDKLQEWKRPDLYQDRPPPLVIEIFVDTAHLAHNQVLVLKDEDGRRFDVANALASSSETSPHPTKNGGRYCEVVLERWTVELGDTAGYTTSELDENLPSVYKKGVVLFRALYTFLRLLPAFKLFRKLLRQTGNYQALKLKFRTRPGRGLARSSKDTLFTPLCPEEHASSHIVEHYDFQPLVTPVGPLHCSVDYRQNCVFGVADAEALISDHFHGLDEGLPAVSAGRSLPDEHTEYPRDRYSSTAAPATTTSRERPRALLGAYGSLGTFHGSDKRGSPVAELRQRALEDDDDDMKRVADLRIEQGATRPKSDFIANPPFKAGSLTSSPRPSPSNSIGKSESPLARYGSSTATSSKRISLNALPQQQLRTPPIASEFAVASSGSSSPKPAPVRYSSSFANRTRRFTSQSSKAAESNTSSGRGSSDSKEKSDHLAEINPDSVGSAKTDDDDIASFLSDLERHKDIKFNTPPGSSRDNVVNLSKYTNMRDPDKLAEEMSSSSLIQASSTPSSRRLSNVPALSTSSSPSRALTHAPHVRSRLSTHSVAEEATTASGLSAEGSSSPQIPEVEEGEEDEDEPFIFPHHQAEEDF